jgi:hypothetical protein
MNATMNISVNLPLRIDVDDYHEIESIGELLKKLNPRIKVKELGCNGRYVGIAYIGTLNDDNVKNMIEQITKREQFNKID